MITKPASEPEPSAASRADLYLQLATAAGREGQLAAEPRFLLLASFWAHRAGLVDVANGCRERIVALQPDHVLRRFPSIADALSHDEFATYVHELGEAYPTSKGEYLLERYRTAGYGGDHPFTQQLAHERWPARPAKKSRPSRIMTIVADRREDRPNLSDDAIPTYEPVPFEWPTASARPSVRLSARWAGLMGMILGLSAGIWIGPRIPAWAELLSRWWDKIWS
ncbi:hypothetical protein K2X85_20185 [bacterium]|nr:hypothetical protein [bacterium]